MALEYRQALENIGVKKRKLIKLSVVSEEKLRGNNFYSFLFGAVF